MKFSSYTRPAELPLLKLIRNGLWKAIHINHREQQKENTLLAVLWGFFGFFEVVFFFFHFIFLKHIGKPANQSHHNSVRKSKTFLEIFINTQHPCISGDNKYPNSGSVGKQPFTQQLPLPPLTSCNTVRWLQKCVEYDILIINHLQIDHERPLWRIRRNN